MKKATLLLLVVALMLLAGCGQSEVGSQSMEIDEVMQSQMVTVTPALETPEPLPTPEPDLVSYADITSGAYNGQYVYINCAVSNVSYDDKFAHVSFDAWIEDGDQYFYDSNWFVFDLDEIEEISILKDAKDGDMFKFLVEVYSDATVGGTGVVSAERLNTTADISQLISQYKESCQRFSCEDLLRTPDAYKGTQISLQGEVFQLVADDDGIVELLLDTGEDNGLAFIRYTRNDGEARILEGDNITVYGTFYLLTDYTTIVGSTNIVPELHAQFLDINA